MTDTCGKCGSQDIQGGSWTPDYCRRCGAIDGAGSWYYDTGSKRIADKYKKEQEEKEEKNVE